MANLSQTIREQKDIKSGIKDTFETPIIHGMEHRETVGRHRIEFTVVAVHTVQPPRSKRSIY
jgi:hypothetical protein